VSYESDMRQFNRWLPPKRFVLGLFAFLVLVPVIALPPYLRAKRSQHWPTANGAVSANWLKVLFSTRNNRRYYRPEITFRYRVGGTDYQSSRISFGFDRSLPYQREAQNILDRYPMGSAVKVYYEPGNPSLGILEPGRNEEMELLYKMDLWFIGIFSFSFVATWFWYDDQKEVAEFSTQPVDRR
jgi:uncharacterized protein DUF3592